MKKQAKTEIADACDQATRLLKTALADMVHLREMTAADASKSYGLFHQRYHLVTQCVHEAGEALHKILPYRKREVIEPEVVEDDLLLLTHRKPLAIADRRKS